jgi:hypothetical protein
MVIVYLFIHFSYIDYPLCPLQVGVDLVLAVPSVCRQGDAWEISGQWGALSSQFIDFERSLTIHHSGASFLSQITSQCISDLLPRFIDALRVVHAELDGNAAHALVVL